MRSRIRLGAAILATAGFLVAAFAWAGDHHKRDHDRDHSWSGADSGQTQAAKAAYEASCGSCHWAFLPQLLPSGSWSKIVRTSNDHFGSDLALSDQAKSDLTAYLTANAADKTSWKIGRKITKGLGGAEPVRVTELSYIQHKHAKLDPAVFQRKGVGSLANCAACHQGASRGDFDDDNVRIPAQ